MHDRHVLERNAETLGYQLSKGCLVTLAVRVRAGQYFDAAGRVDAHLRAFPQAHAAAERADRLRGCNAASLDVGRIAEPAQLAVARGITLALVEALHVG